MNERTQGGGKSNNIVLSGDWILSRAVNGHQDVATPGTEGNVRATISIPISEVMEALQKQGFYMAKFDTGWFVLGKPLKPIPEGDKAQPKKDTPEVPEEIPNNIISSLEDESIRVNYLIINQLIRWARWMEEL